ncbi:Uncharacterised protein [Salmonella enterica subsp. enterica serovar Bovismorbificans]|nr:Uncharacterised protein [Salmonella enterica subsp. enterica serovar Bovismorbificans]
MDHHKTLIQRGNTLCGERIGRVDGRYALEVDMGTRELRRNVIDVVVHGTHHGIHHRFTGVSALAGVANQFLNPLEVDDRHHANQQINMTRDIMLWGDDAAVQSFIKQHIGRFRKRLPGGKRAGNLIPRYGFIIGMQIFTRLAFTRLPVLNKGMFQ